jgi:Tfp pilus assembly protein PilF
VAPGKLIQRPLPTSAAHGHPKDETLRLQLAGYYVADKRPRRAIELLTSILEDNEKNTDVLRARGDALLSVGKHAEAIADYEKALTIDDKDTGVLNNLAWVLSTSPEDCGTPSSRAGDKA